MNQFSETVKPTNSSKGMLMNKKTFTERITSNIYICCIVIYLITVLFSLLNSSDVKTIPVRGDISNETPNWFYNVDGGLLNVPAFTKENTPEKDVIYHLTSTLPSELSSNHSLMFTIRNCMVTVVINGKVIYQAMPSLTNQRVSYLGDMIHIVPIPDSAAEQTIDIRFKPLTDTDATLIDTIYSGNEQHLINTYLKDKLLSLITISTIVFFGIVLFFVGIINNKNLAGKKMICLGFFSVIFGIFCLMQENILQLFFDNSVYLYELKLLTLALLPIPALQYVILSTRVLPTKRRITVEMLPILSFLFILISYVSNTLSLVESLSISITIAAISVIVSMLYSTHYIIQNRLWKNPVKNAPHMIYCTFHIALLIEFITYFIESRLEYLVFSHYLLLLFQIVMFQISFKKLQCLCNIGMNAQHLQNAAYFDTLTGLGNRTALNQAMERLEQSLTPNSSIAIVQLDINYLKRTNDILGHIAGDRLLQNAAKAIQDGFSDYGKCYRFGGDEFVVILENNPKEKYNLGIAAMENSADRINRNLQLLEHVSIAYGVAYYNHETDSGSLWKVQERADEAMYERKRLMKKTHASKKHDDDRL